MDAGHVLAFVRTSLLSLCLLLFVGFPMPVSSQLCESVDRQRSYECTSTMCLRCGQEIRNKTVDERVSVQVTRLPANCTYNAETTTLSCFPDTSLCTIEMCQPCQHCVAEYHKPAGVKLTGAWEFTAHCLNLETHSESPDCESNRLLHPNRCVGMHRIEPYERQGVLSGERDLLGVDCGCYETYNCTAGQAEIKLDFVMLPSGGSTLPTGVGNVTTMDNGSSARLADIYIAIIVIIVLIVAAALLVGVPCIIHAVVKKVRTSRMARIRSQSSRVGTECQQSDQPWHLICTIGQGRYGYVFKTHYHSDVVAVKIFSHNCRTAWETECTLNSMESTSHENIVEFVTSGSRGSGISLQLFIITRYYPLGSLNGFLRMHVVKLEQGCTMMKSIAEGLAHLHSENYTNSSGIRSEKYAIAHRDMKSANVLVKHENGECVIGDLGFAMILDPSLDSKQLASTGQVGTFRYMAPEVLDTRVHLQDLQSFKQIDIYAFSLIMWEVISRCRIYDDEDVPPYQLPFEEMVGKRPSLDTMKDVVVTQKLRPPVPTTWDNDEQLKELTSTLTECWDKDPEARLSAANIVYRMEEFFKTVLNRNEKDCQFGGATPQYQMVNTMATYTSDTMATYTSDTMATAQIGQPMECSQSSPPPYYSPTDPNIVQNSCNEGTQRQHFFPTSMPHINQGSGCGTGNGCGSVNYNRPVLGLRNSACSEGEAVRMNVYNNHQPLSVRNSLILGSERRGETETNFGGASLLYERVLDEIQGENDGSSVGNALSTNGSVGGMDVEEFNLNSDSGVQNIHSSSATSMSSESNSSSSSDSLNSVSSSRLSDELFSKRQLPESSTDTLDLDVQPGVAQYVGAPVISTTNEPPVSNYEEIPAVGAADHVTYVYNELCQSVPAENSNNSIATVTSV